MWFEMKVGRRDWTCRYNATARGHEACFRTGLSVMAVYNIVTHDDQCLKESIDVCCFDPCEFQW